MLAPRPQGPPERISIDEFDPGYDAYLEAQKSGKNVVIYLDGVLQRGPITADSLEGFVKRFALKEDGSPYLGADDKVVIETVKGEVLISVYTPMNGH